MAEGPETIEQSARRIGHHAWLEMRLFEVLGRWSGTVPDPRARAAFATHSRQHAWHAELWHGLLPAVPHLGAAELVAPDEAAAAIVAGLEALDAGGEGASDASARNDGDDSADEGPVTATSVIDSPSLDATAALTAVYREALPHLARAYTAHIAVTTPVTDAPTIRVLRLVLGDLDDERASGDALIEALASRADS
jgi:hypothetical protein